MAGRRLEQIISRVTMSGTPAGASSESGSLVLASQYLGDAVGEITDFFKRGEHVYEH